MADWSQEFDFANVSGNRFGWVDFRNNGTACDFESEEGWKSGYRTVNSGGVDYDEQRISLRRVLNIPAIITQVDVTYTADIVVAAIPRANPFLRATVFLCGEDQASEEAPYDSGTIEEEETVFGQGTHTVHLLSAAPTTCDVIDVLVLVEAGYGTDKNGEATISKIVVQGNGTNPFTVDGWQHEFDFTNPDGDQFGWFDFADNDTPCTFEQEVGWKSGHRYVFAGAYYDEQRISIRKFLPAQANIIQVGVSYVGDFQDQARYSPSLFGRVFRDGVQQSYIEHNHLGNDEGTVYALNDKLHKADRIDLVLLAEAGYGSVAQGGATLSKVTLYGVGANPFILDDAFAALRDTLQDNPSATLDLTDYKNAIQDAFGVILDADSGAGAWTDNFVALHFARLGLEAAAKAFETWVNSQPNTACTPVNRFDLFKRIMGSVRLKNVTTVQDYPAENIVDTGVPVIAVYTRPAGGQWYMTPNNVIHELGHWFSNKAGFAFSQLGSVAYTITDTSKGGGPTLHDNLSRHGMAEGRDYLRVRVWEHTKIEDNDSNNIPEYTVMQDGQGQDKHPLPNDPEYSEFVPARYLFYDIADNRFDVWRSPVYHDRYGDNARIDTLVQNEEDNETETSADAFLNWVRDQEYQREHSGVRSRRPFYNAPGETNAGNWINFFINNIGMFLRNATIYHRPGGIVQFYKDYGQSAIPQTPITNGVLNTGYGNYGIHPSPKEIPNVFWGVASSLPTSIPIYGWVTPAEPIADGSLYWLLIADNKDRLCWLEANAIDHHSNLLNSQNETNPALISPDRAYVSSDLSVILGE